ncbi:MAG TPA: type V CRISPR-associated protein Cas12b, partial [Candidatus Paceibacterota bacterium]|nr:type V CRISPR-associated protein Cas12b [Verrucomicrobiota bacterium]HRY51785.1 type V CRISPR-associated protein Cas12b [Candidatus Paceibacterota bacterium]
MNRIYQGRVGAVVVPKPSKAKKGPVEWIPLGFTPDEYAKVKNERCRLLQMASGNDEAAANAKKRLAALNREEHRKWETALREQHMTFQDAVNYYFLALAAMAEGLMPAEEGARPREVERLKVELQERKDARKKRKAKANDEEKKRDDEIEEQITRLRREEAVWQWRNQVRDTWEKVKRGAEQFEGPKAHLTKLLGLDEGADSFEDACKVVCRLSKATPMQRAEAVLYLMELAGSKADLSPLVESKMPWLSNPSTADLTDDATRSKRRKLAQLEVRRLAKLDAKEFANGAKDFDPALFVTKSTSVQADEARQGMREAFNLAVAYQANPKTNKPFTPAAKLAPHKETFERQLPLVPDDFAVCIATGKHQKEYRFAVVLKTMFAADDGGHGPDSGINALRDAAIEAFHAITKTLVGGKEVKVVETDWLKEGRTADDTKYFEYFSNLKFTSPSAPSACAKSEDDTPDDDDSNEDEDGAGEDTGKSNRAIWFEWDKAAFVEALKFPHRYYQDTLKRDEECARLESRRDKMKGEGGDSAAGNEDEDTYGFKNDHRIDAIQELVRESDLLGYLEEDNDEEDRQYPIHDNTLRGWSKLCQAWREAADKLKESDPAELERELDRIRLEQQGERPEEAGGGGLFKVLQRAKYHCIWRDTPKGNQADDPLWAWVNFRELEEKIESLKLPIRFTPAHAAKSPRFFNFPKTPKTDGKPPKNSDRPGLKSAHVPGMFARNESGEIIPVKGGESWLGDRPRMMALNAGVLVETKEGLQPTAARIYYAAPRLRRDAIRRDGESSLGSVAMIQPMMEALGLAPAVPTVNFANCAVRLHSEPEDANDEGAEWRINLDFPASVEPEELLKHELFGHGTKWNRQTYKSGKAHAQFNFSGGDDLHEISLRWPKEWESSKRPTDPKTDRWFNHDRFTCLPVDLGQRVGGAFAVLDVRAGSDFGKNKQGKPVPSRFIGETPGKRWHAAVAATGLLSMSGEDTEIFRTRTSPDDRNKKDTKPGKGFREELWGDKGRPPLRAGDPGALRDETEEARRLLKAFGQMDIMPPGWDQRGNTPSTQLSFPEQNDNLLKAVSRYMSRIRRLHRWCAFLKPNDKDKRTAERQARALNEIREACGLDECGKTKTVKKTGDPATGESWLAPLVRALVEDGKCDAALQSQLADLLRPMLEALPGQMETIANRCVPLRGRSWKWEQSDEDEQGKPLHILRQSSDAIPTARMKMSDGKEREVTWIRGQRGFSSQRIEQIEFLRKLLQSLNSIQRRTIGELVKRQKRSQDGQIPRLPDCCPDLLDKIAELKEQRVNQLAHQILAEALGVRLRRDGPGKGDDMRATSDIHGEYERIPCRLDPSGFRRPVDFIVIEDLKYYDTAAIRSRRENTRLMRWCRRHFRNKLKQLCEVFGIPVVESNPADSSKFCSRSGVAGFRAVEVGPGFEHDFVWNKALKKLDDPGAKLDHAEEAHCKAVSKLVKQVAEAQKIPRKDGTLSGKPRTLLAPLGSGNVFVPIVGEISGSAVAPGVVQADINAAINLGLRAIADPRLWDVHPRLRTLRSKSEKKGEPAPLELSTREKRKYGETSEKLSLNRCSYSSEALIVDVQIYE